MDQGVIRQDFQATNIIIKFSSNIPRSSSDRESGNANCCYCGFQKWDRGQEFSYIDTMAPNIEMSGNRLVKRRPHDLPATTRHRCDK